MKRAFAGALVAASLGLARMAQAQRAYPMAVHPAGFARVARPAAQYQHHHP